MLNKREKIFETRYLPFVFIIAAAALFIRYLCAGYMSPDYGSFLRPWVEEFRAGGGFAALKNSVSNYNLPYLYFLAIFSYLPVSDLYMIKLLSVVFDFIIALTLADLVKSYTRKQSLALMAFALVLLWPTFWLNSAYWAQCDSIYAAFCLLSFSSAMKNRPSLSVIFATLALTFKLQAIFFIPLFIIFLIGGKVKLRHAALVPLTYAAVSLPGLALGWPAERLITVYTGQVEIYSGYLTLNAPSMFALLPGLPKHPYFEFGIAASAVFIIVMILGAVRLRGRLEEKHYAAFAAAFCVGLPWLLPSMHDRYFYLAEIFLLLFAFCEPKRWYYPAFALYGSLMGYHAYLVLGVLSDQLWLAACFMLYPFARVCIDIFDFKKQAAKLDL